MKCASTCRASAATQNSFDQSVALEMLSSISSIYCLSRHVRTFVFVQGSSSNSKRRKKSVSAQDSDSDLEIPGFSSEDDVDSDVGGSDSDDGEMADSPVKKKELPVTVEGLQEEAAVLTVDLNEKVEKVKTLRTEQM